MIVPDELDRRSEGKGLSTQHRPVLCLSLKVLSTDALVLLAKRPGSVTRIFGDGWYSTKWGRPVGNGVGSRVDISTRSGDLEE